MSSPPLSVAPAEAAAALHVLLVDDDESVRVTVASLLEEADYRVSQAGDGSAMRDLIDSGDFVDVVIMDVNMPGETSESLALYVSELGLPLVMISGSRRAIQFAQANALQLLVKPFTLAELDDAVQAAVASPEAGRRRAEAGRG